MTPVKRVLLRAGKGPFDVFSPEATRAENRIATNSGNLVFSHATYKLLSAPGVEIVPNEHTVDPAQADRINEEYDAFVVPLANAFRPGFEKHLATLTELIERLRIPVVVFGVGAQADVEYDLSPMTGLEDVVKRFARAVLNSAPSIGVRGELTERYLKGLGFHDIDVIGCPSMFMYGDRLSVTKRVTDLDPESRIAINLSPHLEVAPYFEAHPNASIMGSIASRHWERYPNLVYIPQEISGLDLMLWGESVADLGRTDQIPLYSSHPLFAEGRIRFFVDPWTWMSYLRDVDFVFGTRIHGNIAGLLAGTPSYVIAHDSRTLELARYFELPHRKITEISPDLDAAELYAEADFGPMIRGHKARFDTLLDFMRKHDLASGFEADGAVPSFDHRLAETTFPAPVEPLGDHNVASRVRYLADESLARRRGEKSLRTRVGKQEKTAKSLEKDRDRIDKSVRGLSEQNAKLAKRVESLERQAARARNTPYRRLRRRAGRLLRSVRARRR